jgi:hypothetical protein
LYLSFERGFELNILSSFAGSLMLSMTYGIQARSKDDPYIDMVKQTMHTLSEVGHSSWPSIMDALPWLRFGPKLLSIFGGRQSYHGSPPVKLPKVTYELVRQASVRSYIVIVP